MDRLEALSYGFCQMRAAQIGKTSGVLHRALFVNTFNCSTKRNRAVQKSGGFATKKQFALGCKTPGEGGMAGEYLGFVSGGVFILQRT